MMRRAFSNMDKAQRRRLLDELRTVARGDGGTLVTGAGAGVNDACPAFEAAMALLLTILGLGR